MICVAMIHPADTELQVLNPKVTGACQYYIEEVLIKKYPASNGQNHQNRYNWEK